MQQVSLDALIAIFSNTLGSLKGSWGLSFATFVICKYDIHNYKVLYAALWAVLVSIVIALIRGNRAFVSSGPARLAKGDLVVITGAASGLGFYISAALSQTNPVVALDVNDPPMQLQNVRFVKVDCSNELLLAKTLESVKAHTLINCLGTVTGGSTTDLDSKDIRKMYEVNLMGPIWATRALLPHMASLQGYIVNVSSSTSYVGPRKAGIYASSKAAVRIWHESLTQELRGTPVKTILVIPGQLDTPMFKNVETPDKFMAPVVPCTVLGDEIIYWLRSGYAGHIIQPSYTRILPAVLSILPQSLIQLLRSWNGLDKSMDEFQ